VDLVLAYNKKYIRYYIGTTAIFSTIPRDVNKFILQAGFDFDYSIISNNLKIIGGYDSKLNGTKNLKNI
jgi:hypothetical protein